MSILIQLATRPGKEVPEEHGIFTKGEVSFEKIDVVLTL